MPQFLTTSGTSHLIEDIIIKASAELVLITPYLKLSRILAERLTEADKKGVRIRLVYGKSELHPSEKRQLDAMTNVELLYLENLHAKCYFNENALIVASMNLYEFSEKNNREMGILLTRRDDSECFADALAEAHSIMSAAKPVGRQKVATALLSKTQISSQQVTANPPPLLIAKKPDEKPEYEFALMIQKAYDLLKHGPSYRTKVRIQKEPHSFQSGKMQYTVFATDFPRRGIDLKFDGSIRFDFVQSEDYHVVRDTQRHQIDRLLAGYRCYWNRDVIQIYAAENYRHGDEQTTAKYMVKAIKNAAEALKSFPLTNHIVRKYNW
jgi:hypothetical protein